MLPPHQQRQIKWCGSSSPMASRVFGHTRRHSPGDLLIARAAGDPHDKTGHFNLAAATSTCDSPEFPEFQSSFEQPTDLVILDLKGACGGNENTYTRLFPLDETAEELRKFDFALVRDAAAMASAFRAGCIPVFYGSVSIDGVDMFDPRAFVDCSQHESLHVCAAQVSQLSNSVDLMAESRDQAPIVDDVAFAKAFFWYPDALESHLSAGARVQQQIRYHSSTKCSNKNLTVSLVEFLS